MTFNHISKNSLEKEGRELSKLNSGPSKIVKKELHRRTKKETEKIKETIKKPKDINAFRKYGDITPAELGDKINSKIDKLSKTKKNIGMKEINRIKKEVIESLSQREIEEIMKKRIKKLDEKVTGKDGKKLDQTLYNKIQENDPKLKKVLKIFSNDKIGKNILVTFGADKLKVLAPILEKYKKEGKKIPDDLEGINNLIVGDLANSLKKEAFEISNGDKSKIPNDTILKEKAQKVLNLGNNQVLSSISGCSSVPFKQPDYSNVKYEMGKEFPEDIKKELEKIYSPANKIENKRMLDTLNHLSDFHNAKRKFAEFVIDIHKSGLGKLTQGNGNEGGVRTLEKQREIMQRAGATKVKDPSRSWHTKGAAIDLMINGKEITVKNHSNIIKIAAKHGLYNGGVMWGFDGWHFQAGCSGRICNNPSGYQAKANKGLLPKNKE